MLNSLSAFVQMTSDACHCTLHVDSDYQWSDNLKESNFK